MTFPDFLTIDLSMAFLGLILGAVLALIISPFYHK